MLCQLLFQESAAQVAHAVWLYFLTSGFGCDSSFVATLRTDISSVSVAPDLKLSDQNLTSPHLLLLMLMTFSDLFGNIRNQVPFLMSVSRPL